VNLLDIQMSTEVEQNPESRESTRSVLNCPDSIWSEEEAWQLLHHAQNLRDVYKKNKDDCYTRLHQALLEAQQADTQLFEIDDHIGRLRYVIRKSGFPVPSFNGNSPSPARICIDGASHTILLGDESDDLDGNGHCITVILD
jgi:hypothetical protein